MLVMDRLKTANTRLLFKSGAMNYHQGQKYLYDVGGGCGCYNDAAMGDCCCGFVEMAAGSIRKVTIDYSALADRGVELKNPVFTNDPAGGTVQVTGWKIDHSNRLLFFTVTGAVVGVVEKINVQIDIAGCDGLLERVVDCVKVHVKEC